MGVKESGSFWGLFSLVDRRWTWQVLSRENVQGYYPMSSQNTCRGQDLIHLLLMVGELSNWREGSMLQKWLIDSCVYQRELGGHLSCPRHRALQVSLNEGHACSQGQNTVQVVPCALNIGMVLSWPRLVFSISLWDRWNTKERTTWTSSWIREKLIYCHIVEARNNNVPDCGLGLWVLHWFYLQVLSFWVIVPSEVYFCCNFPSISWKLVFWCTKQRHSTKLVANSSRAEGIVYFFVVAVHMIYLVIWKTTVWESQEPTLMWETKQKGMLLTQNEGLSSFQHVFNPAFLHSQGCSASIALLLC